MTNRLLTLRSLWLEFWSPLVLGLAVGAAEDRQRFFSSKISISVWFREGSKIIWSFINFYLNLITLNILRWKSLAWEQFMQMELQETLMAGVRAPLAPWPAVIMANTFAGTGECTYSAICPQPVVLYIFGAGAPFLRRYYGIFLGYCLQRSTY